MEIKRKPSWQKACELCLPTILKLANQLAKVPNSVIDKDDLVSCGFIGLLEAHNNYQLGRDAKFSTFAYFRIKGAMLDEMRRHQPHKRNVIDKYKKIEKAKRKMAHLKECEATKQSLSQLSGLSGKEIEKIVQLVAFRRVETKLEEISTERGNPENVVQLRQRKENLDKAVSNLNPAEQSVIRFRFGRDLRLKEIGTKLELSEARVHQLEKTALVKLKEIMQDDDWEIAA